MHEQNSEDPDGTSSRISRTYQRVPIRLVEEFSRPRRAWGSIGDCHQKQKGVNAVRLAGMFLDRLPRQSHSPETTADREGFIHPYRIEGGVAETTLRILTAESRRLVIIKIVVEN